MVNNFLESQKTLFWTKWTIVRKLDNWKSAKCLFAREQKYASVSDCDSQGAAPV